MEIKTDFSLKTLNTFRVEAAASRYVRFGSEREIVDFLSRNTLNDRHHLVLGGGSNLLFVDDFDGIVLHPMLMGVDMVATDQKYFWIRAMAGENWDNLVALAVTNGWGGLENLSLIPGSVGASAVQNIGAYGVEVKTVIERVEAIAISDRQKIAFAPEDCGFGYRFSNFKGYWAGQFIITAVVFRLKRQPDYVLDYPGLQAALQSQAAIDLKSIRQAIVSIRQSKLPDPAEIGNAGSFFKNPVVDGTTLSRVLQIFPDLPFYPQGQNQFKLAAGWLIEACGWKGKQVGKAAVHDRQALVLVNLGEATGREIFDLSEQVRRSVQVSCGIDLEREVMVVP